MWGKTIAILGITGSIGMQTVQVVEYLGLKIVAASAGRRVKQLKELKERYDIEAIYSPYASYDRKQFEEKVFDADILMVAISDVSELPLVLRFLETGKRVAIATKEMLVLGAEWFSRYKWKNLYPVDSEHATLYVLMKPYVEYVKEVYLTASGGAFRDLTLEEIDNIDPIHALKHPVWNMGSKITVDSATLANKGIELLEARILFDISPQRLKAIIHREVLVHAMVVLNDGFTIMGAYKPSMLLPIQFAITYPNFTSSLVEEIKWSSQTLHFEPIPIDKYGMYRLAKEILNTDDIKNYILYLISDDIVVSRYLNGNIRFSQMPVLAEKIIGYFSNEELPSNPLERVQWYNQIREMAKEVR